MTIPKPRHTQRLLAAAKAGARITTTNGLPVRLEPRATRDSQPWVDEHGKRYSGGQCIAGPATPARPRRLTPGEIRRIATRTGIDWEQILGRAW